MTPPDDNFLVEVREKTRIGKKIIGALVTLLGALGVLYFVYWVAVMTDKTFIEYGGEYFYPLAHVFFPNDDSYIVFQHTSFILFGLILPCFIGHYLLEKFEESAIQTYAELVRKKELEEQAKEKEKLEHSYDDITNYSICFSIEIKDCTNKQEEKEIADFVYSKVKKAFSDKITDVHIYISDYLILRSNDFGKFDYVFESLIKVLSKIREALVKKYAYEYIPSITVDAFPASKKNLTLERQHFQIGTFNFKNRALSTMTFSKKYKFLQNEKYAGIPIGEYAYFDKTHHNSYELNVIYKNLDAVLKNMR